MPQEMRIGQSKLEEKSTIVFSFVNIIINLQKQKKIKTLNSTLGAIIIFLSKKKNNKIIIEIV